MTEITFKQVELREVSDAELDEIVGGVFSKIAY